MDVGSQRHAPSSQPLTNVLYVGGENRRESERENSNAGIETKGKNKILG
jgi:hypothetical protein